MINRFKRILPVILLCFILLTHLHACGSDGDNNGAGDTGNSDGSAETEPEIEMETTTEIEIEIEIKTEAEDEDKSINETEDVINGEIHDETDAPEEISETEEPQKISETSANLEDGTPAVTTAVATTEPATEPPAPPPTQPPTQPPTPPPTQPPAPPSSATTTAAPRVDMSKYSHNTSYLIGGKCEIGAMIRVTGGTEEIYTGSDHGDFLVEVPFKTEGAATLRLTAEVPGKEPSEEIIFEVKPQKDVNYYASSGSFGVIVGYNYMTYFHDCLPDYTGSNLISESDITALTQRTAKKIDDLRNRGCNAEIVYLLVPNTMKIFAENVPARYTRHNGETLLSQWKRGLEAGGATVVDLTDVMTAHKNDEYKIWHKTDSHWTEYGAYIGYTALMNHIAQRFPDAAPRPRSDFEFYNQEVNFGDIYATLGLTLSDLRETTAFAKFNFDPPKYNSDYNTGHVYLYDQNCALNRSARLIHARVSFAHTTKTNLSGLNLPSAYIMRDSFEGPLHAFYTDRFSTATFASMWNYNFNVNEIVRLNPDYVIYVISERTIKTVLYE